MVDWLESVKKGYASCVCQAPFLPPATYQSETCVVSGRSAFATMFTPPLPLPFWNRYSRFAAVFAEHGYEDPEDLTFKIIRADELMETLMHAGAKQLHVTRIAAALVDTLGYPSNYLDSFTGGWESCSPVCTCQCTGAHRLVCFFGGLAASCCAVDRR